jgi:ornithine carbamoyltransferase
MKQKNLISLFDYSTQQIQKIIERGRQVKEDRLQEIKGCFAEKSCVLLFEKPSLRTRITFETAINELGGFAINLEPSMVQMGTRETVEDVARNLRRWVHCIVARTFAHNTLIRLAQYSQIPVVNALSDTFHPCQALAFGLTILERFGTRPITVAFVGDGNNVCNSLMILSAKLGYTFVAAAPHGFEPDETIVAQCSAIAESNGGTVSVGNDPRAAVKRADVIYTDVWTSMGQEHEARKRKNIFTDFQINDTILSYAPSEVVVSHCLPAHRGEEITDEIMDSDRMIAFDEAENRLHAQKAVLIELFS